MKQKILEEISRAARNYNSNDRVVDSVSSSKAMVWPVKYAQRLLFVLWTGRTSCLTPPLSTYNYTIATVIPHNDSPAHSVKSSWLFM